LSERDKETVRTLGRRPVGIGERPALVLVDNYVAAYGSRADAAADDYRWLAVDAQRRVLDVARETGVPVVHVSRQDERAMPGWNMAIHAGDKRGRTDIGRQDAEGNHIVEPLAPRDNEVFLHKTAPSAFWGTPLAGILTYLGVDSLFVCGQATGGCVRATVVDAVSHRLRVTVPEDCVFDTYDATHAINLFDMHSKYADVVDSSHVIDWMRQHPR